MRGVLHVCSCAKDPIEKRLPDPIKDMGPNRKASEQQVGPGGRRRRRVALSWWHRVLCFPRAQHPHVPWSCSRCVPLCARGTGTLQL